MSGTPIGGKRAAITNKKRHGENFFKTIGRKGGLVHSNGGFASLKVGKDGLTGLQRAKICGSLGGKKSKRGPAKDDIDKAEEILEAEGGRD